MDRQTKQWMTDRIIWILGLAVAVLVTVPAIAAEPDRPAVAADGSTVQYGRPAPDDVDRARPHHGKD